LAKKMALVNLDAPPVPSIAAFVASQPKALREQLTRHGERVSQLVGEALAPTTRHTYWYAWGDLVEFALSLGQDPRTRLDPAFLAMWVQDMIDATRPLDVIRGHLAAVNTTYRLAGLPAPGEDPVIKRLVVRARRLSPRAQPKQGLFIEDMEKLIGAIDDPVRYQDVALLTLYRAGLDPGTLARISVARLSIDEEGLHASVDRHSRWGSHELLIDVPRRAGRTDPVWAVQGLIAKCHSSGLLFPRGRKGDAGFTAEGIQRRLQRIARRWSPPGAAPDLERCSDTAFVELVQRASRPTLMDERDAALICTLFGGAMRRSEAAVRWGQLDTPDGEPAIWLQESKTDPYGHGQWVELPRSDSFLGNPLVSYRHRIAEIIGGDPIEVAPAAFIFVPMSSPHTLSQADPDKMRPLTGEAIRLILKRRLKAADFEADEYSPHSLRRGMTGTMLRKEHPETVAKATRMATLQNVMRYDARSGLGRIVLQGLTL
jgi:integrase